ncbi:hypothetical protein vseg_007932 [Gypsophila vaccaria]
MAFTLRSDLLSDGIVQGAINLLIAVYKKELSALGGYLTDGSKPNLTKVEYFIQVVGSYEDQIFDKRARLHQRQADRIKREKGRTSLLPRFSCLECDSN